MKVFTKIFFALLIFSSCSTSTEKSIEKGDCGYYGNYYYRGWKEGKAPRTQYNDTTVKIKIDTKKFRVYFCDYAKDDSSVFYQGQKIKEADAKTFYALNENYAKDDSSAFYQGQKIKGAIAKTFKALNIGHAKDSSSVFFGSEKIEGADAKTFELLGDYRYAKDKNTGYFENRPIVGSHGSTFEMLFPNYATDGFDIFYEATPLHVLDAKNYRRIPTVTNAWATDGKAFYWHNQKVPTEDIENFMIFVDTKGETVECFSKDKNWVYNGTSKLNFNRKGEKFIDTIDAATFEGRYYGFSRDKFGFISLNPDVGHKGRFTPTPNPYLKSFSLREQEYKYRNLATNKPKFSDIVGEYKISWLCKFRLDFPDSLLDNTLIQLNADSTFILKNLPVCLAMYSDKASTLISGKGTWTISDFREAWVIPLTFEQTIFEKTQYNKNDYTEHTKIHYFDLLKINKNSSPYEIYVNRSWCQNVVLKKK